MRLETLLMISSKAWTKKKLVKSQWNYLEALKLGVIGRHLDSEIGWFQDKDTGELQSRLYTVQIVDRSLFQKLIYP